MDLNGHGPDGPESRFLSHMRMLHGLKLDINILLISFHHPIISEALWVATWRADASMHSYSLDMDFSGYSWLLWTTELLLIL